MEEKKRFDDDLIEKYARERLNRQNKIRRTVIIACAVCALICIGVFGIDYYRDKRAEKGISDLINAKERTNEIDIFHKGDYEPTTGIYIDPVTKKELSVLDEYKNLLSSNPNLIGWLKIADNNTGKVFLEYPVVQTTDNDYYLNHDMNQNIDQNGTIFMDKDCDAVNLSDNLILYGHHMKNGKMFGSLDKYASEDFYKTHKTISFDTIYEKGTYEVMYVFRSRVYNEDEIVFKYYQFIDANGEREFNSNMAEMEKLSLYDTGVTASYGDTLLTLSTCDYQETNGRFVVVAKKVSN